MKIKTHLFTAMILAAAPFAQALEVNVDPAHSNVGFEIKHLVVSTVRGNFTDFNGAIDLNEKDFKKSKFNFTVKTASINTSNAKRDEHLKSPDFFDATKFPEASFASQTIKAKGKNTYTMEGELTIHGEKILTPFVLTNLGKVKDPYGVEKYMFQAVADVNRKDFGLVYNAKLESGGVVLGEKVKLIVDLEAAPKLAEKK